MRVAVIPARGGSKRIARKNIRSFVGKPVMAYSIEAAQSAEIFDKIIVSTDDQEIAQVAESLGAEVPFVRPAELSDDKATTIPVIRHAIDWLTENVETVDYACCIYAAAPFVRAEDLRRSFDVLQDQQVEFVFPVTSFPFPIFRALKIEPSGQSTMFWPEHELTRSQDLPDAYHDAGQFYWGTADAYRQRDGFFSASTAPIVLPRHMVQDIDTPEDWVRAEHMFRVLFENEIGQPKTIPFNPAVGRQPSDLDEEAA